MSELLSGDERVKADRFHFQKHRTSYIIGRAILRRILTCYTGVAPEQVNFTYGARGKPAVSDSSISFNVSHSGDLALYALAREPLLGVDVERIRPISDVDAIARRFFSPSEYADLLSLDPTDRDAGFFRCWTRKEAYIKAIGDGLHAPLDRFRVTLLPDQPPALLAIEDDAERASRWTVFDLRPSHDFAAALAIFGRGWELIAKGVFR